MKRILSIALAAAGLCACAGNEVSVKECGTWCLVEQTKGPELGYSPESGVSILEVDGYAFKDLNNNADLRTDAVLIVGHCGQRRIYTEGGQLPQE